MKIGLKKKEEARKKRNYLFLNRMLNIVPRNQRMQKKLFQKKAYQPARLNVANEWDEKKIIFFFISESTKWIWMWTGTWKNSRCNWLRWRTSIPHEVVCFLTVFCNFDIMTFYLCIYLLFCLRKGTNEAALVFARDAKKICPQIVLDFLEDRLVWKGHPTSDD